MLSVNDRIVVDEIFRESGWVRLDTSEGPVDIPLKYFPEQVKEGDIIKLEICKTEETEIESNVSRLESKLFRKKPD